MALLSPLISTEDERWFNGVFNLREFLELTGFVLSKVKLFPNGSFYFLMEIPEWLFASMMNKPGSKDPVM